MLQKILGLFGYKLVKTSASNSKADLPLFTESEVKFPDLAVQKAVNEIKGRTVATGTPDYLCGISPLGNIIRIYNGLEITLTPERNRFIASVTTFPTLHTVHVQPPANITQINANTLSIGSHSQLVRAIIAIRDQWAEKTGRTPAPLID